MISTFDRRTFLRTGLAAGAGLLFAPACVKASQSDRSLRLGFIGMGGRGSSLLPVVLMFPGVKIPAVCDLLPERAHAGATKVEQLSGSRPQTYSGTETAWTGLIERDDLDAVIIATPWEWHTRMAVAAMRSGKYPGVEVPAAVTLQECWDLVRTSEKTGVPCMMLENVCYFQNVLTLLRMIREGLFGDLIHCEAGYQHDCRSLAFDAQGNLTWRGRHQVALNGNLYPTHPLGPIAQWMNINRGDRFVSLTSMSTPPKGLRQYAAARFGAAHPAARHNYKQGDINTTLIQTARGLTVTLYYNMSTHRPYDLILRVQGVNGIYQGLNNSICLQGDGPGEQWQPFEPYQEKYVHPLWTALAAGASKSGGHGGAEYLMFHDFLKAVRNKTPAPQTVYDAAAWSAIMPLSIKSVAKGGDLVEFPDFTGGKWKTAPPFSVYGA